MNRQESSRNGVFGNFISRFIHRLCGSFFKILVIAYLFERCNKLLNHAGSQKITLNWAASSVIANLLIRLIVFLPKINLLLSGLLGCTGGLTLLSGNGHL